MLFIPDAASCGVLRLKINASTAQPEEIGTAIESNQKRGPYKTVDEYLDQSDEDLRTLFDSLKTYLLGLGDEVQL